MPGNGAITRREPKQSPAPFFVDAFAGCGGLSLGLMRAGWRGLLAIESDPFAFETLSTNLLRPDGRFSFAWPSTIEEQPWDIRDLISHRHAELADLSGQVDLLAGGPPCQGFSHAGRRNPRDSRNLLFKAYLELVALLRPRLVLLENVLGFRHDFRASGRRRVRNFAATLEEGLRQDYEIETAVLRADDYGVPQARPRFFLVGARRDGRSEPLLQSFFPDLESAVPDFLGERGLPRRPTARGAISDLEVRRNGTTPSPDSPGFQAIRYRRPNNPYQRAMRDGHRGPPPDTRLARHLPHITARFAALIEDSRRLGHPITIPASVRAAHDLRKATVRVLASRRPAPTITSLPDDLLHYSEPRILTLRETARLQSFPDWFAFNGNYTTGGSQRRRQVPRFTQVANAVPPLLAEQLGLRLLSLRPSAKLGDDRTTNGFHRSPMVPEPKSHLPHPLLVDDLSSSRPTPV